MKRFLAPLLIALVAMFSGIGFVAHCPGCIDPARVNKTCEWTGDLPAPLDLNNPAQQAHLVADAQLAEDLAIRDADAAFLRLYGYQGHGGLIDHHRIVDQCMARLITAIQRNHRVTTEQIAAARGQRSRLFDTAAALSFLPLFVCGATVVCRRLSVRLPPDERRPWLIAASLLSLAATAVAILLGQLWLAVWETIRVRNGHMSLFRAATQHPWPKEHIVALFVGGVVAFWAVAAGWRRMPRTLPLNAAIFACVMLATMFVAVFVQHAIGYVVVLAAGVMAPALVRAE